MQKAYGSGMEQTMVSVTTQKKGQMKVNESARVRLGVDLALGEDT
jgi:hypothetical protein